jgi:hypothetical protein
MALRLEPCCDRGTEGEDEDDKDDEEDDRNEITRNGADTN